MARGPHRALFLALAAAFLAALPASAAEASLERVPGSPDPVLRLTPIEPERIRPPPTPGLVVPSVSGRRTFVLRYGSDMPQDPAKRPGSLVLHVPHEYARVRADGPVEVWSLALWLLHPSLRPATPGQGRCAQHWCGDEISVLLRLVPSPQPSAASADMRSRFAAGFLAKNGTMTYETAPAPPGYEEAFTRTRTVQPDRPYELFLVHRDERDEQQIGRCNLDAPYPGCEFHYFDPRTNLLVTYEFQMTLLPQRQAIEDGLRGLVGGWQAEGR